MSDNTSTPAISKFLTCLTKMVLDYGSQMKRVEDSEDTATALSVRDSDKSKPYIPLAGVATDGWSKEDEATATCFCGAVQLAFVSAPTRTLSPCCSLFLQPTNMS